MLAKHVTDDNLEEDPHRDGRSRDGQRGLQTSKTSRVVRNQGRNIFGETEARMDLGWCVYGNIGRDVYPACDTGQFRKGHLEGVAYKSHIGVTRRVHLYPTAENGW